MDKITKKSIKLIYLAIYRTKRYDKPFDLQYYLFAAYFEIASISKGVT